MPDTYGQCMQVPDPAASLCLRVKGEEDVFPRKQFGQNLQAGLESRRKQQRAERGESC